MDQQINGHNEFLNGKSLKANLFILLTVVCLLLLAWPYLPTVLFAMMLLMAVTSAKKRLALLSLKRRRIYLVSMAFASLLILFLTVQAVGLVFDTIEDFSDQEAQAKLRGQLTKFIGPMREKIVHITDSFLPEHRALTLIDQKTNQTIGQLADTVSSMVFSFFKNAPDYLLFFALFVVTIYYLRRYYVQIRRRAVSYFPDREHKEMTREFWTMLEESSYGAIVSTLLISGIQGLILATGAWIAGSEHWALFFVGGMIFSLIPVVGLLPIILMGIYSLYQEGGTSGAIIFGVIGFFATLADNLFRTLFMSAKDDILPGAINFFLLIGALYTFGFAGIVIGPFLIILIGQMLRAYLAED